MRKFWPSISPVENTHIYIHKIGPRNFLFRVCFFSFFPNEFRAYTKITKRKKYNWNSRLGEGGVRGRGICSVRGVTLYGCRHIVYIATLGCDHARRISGREIPSYVFIVNNTFGRTRGE